MRREWIRDILRGIVGSIPYVLGVALGFAWGSILVYVCVAWLAVTSRSVRTLAIRFVSFATSIFVFGMSWALSNPWYAVVSIALVLIGFGAPAAITFVLRRRRYVAAVFSTASFVVILVALESMRWVPAFLSMSWVFPAFSRSVALFGHIPISALMFFASALLVYAPNRWLRVTSLVILVMPLTGALIAADPQSLEQPIDVAIVQSSIDDRWEWRTAHAFDDHLERYIEPTAEAMRSGADLIVWPEHSVPADVRFAPDFDPIMHDLARRGNATIVLGTFEIVNGSSGPYYPGARIYDPASDEVLFIRAHSPIGISSNARGTRALETARVSVGELELTIGVLICYEEFTDAAWLDDSGIDLLIVLSDYNDLGGTKSITTRTTMIQSERFEVPVLKAANGGPSMVIASDGSVLATGRAGSEQLILRTLE